MKKRSKSKKMEGFTYIDPKKTPRLKQQCKTAAKQSMKDFEYWPNETDYKALKELIGEIAGPSKPEKDLAYLQVCVEAMGERLDALEAENARLRAMWGGVTHSGQPYWVSGIKIGPDDTITA